MFLCFSLTRTREYREYRRKGHEFNGTHVKNGVRIVCWSAAINFEIVIYLIWMNMNKNN